MKKLIAILFLLVFPLFLTGARQQENKYVDSNKKDTVTISIIAESKKQIATNDNLQLQFAKVVENQTTVNKSLSEAISSMSSGINTAIKEIEKRNKSDTKLLTDIFNYPQLKVTKAINKEKWISFTIFVLVLLYLFYIIQMLNRRATSDILLIKLLLYSMYGIVVFAILKFLLTLIFNGDFYVIKELINLYS